MHTDNTIFNYEKYYDHSNMHKTIKTFEKIKQKCNLSINNTKSIDCKIFETAVDASMYLNKKDNRTIKLKENIKKYYFVYLKSKSINIIYKIKKILKLFFWEIGLYKYKRFNNS